MDTNIQLISLILSVLYLSASLYLAKTSETNRQWIYISLSLGWVGGVVFYSLLLFTDMLAGYGHVLSAHLRLYQYVCFGSWILFRACEKLCATNVSLNLQRRMVAWIMKLRKIL